MGRKTFLYSYPEKEKKRGIYTAGVKIWISVLLLFCMAGCGQESEKQAGKEAAAIREEAEQAEETAVNSTENSYTTMVAEEEEDDRPNDSDENVTVHGGLRYEDGEWHDVEWESREAFLAQFGLENSDPVYQYNQNDMLYLEVYQDASEDRFYGISYEDYTIDGKGEKKAATVYGFIIDESFEEEWNGENAYSAMTAFRAEEQDSVKEYEEFIEYTPDGLPAHFYSQGKIITQAEAGESPEWIMRIDYVYRDDDTLLYRSYGHNSAVFSTTYCSRDSYYDEKGRVVYEEGYHTNGYLRDYYFYEDEGEMPAYHLNIHYSHGGALPYLTKYFA